MKRNLKVYKVTLTTLSPVFIGSGKVINKKEYLLFDKEKKIWVMDQGLLYSEISKRGYQSVFEKYLIDNRNRLNLSDWLKVNNISEDSLKDAVKYKVNYGDRFSRRRKTSLQVMEFMKDAYNMPYIPGTSLKGLLRTVILSDFISMSYTNREKAGYIFKDGKKSDDEGKKYLLRSSEKIETVFFRTLNRFEKKRNHPLNDVFQGVIVSDSKPLSIKSLVLCQKIDKQTNGYEKYLPILRECIKPGEKIEFTLTIDTSVCKFTDIEILRAVRKFADMYYDTFSSAFGKIDRPSEDTVYLGGGVGFLSKTVVYPIFGREEGIEETVDIFKKKDPKDKHKHSLDSTKCGVSPHMLKCTTYKGESYEFGKCKFEMEEII